MIKQGWVEHDSVRLHYLIRDGDPHLTPLVYVPGSLGSADDFRDEMEGLAPRTTVAMDKRGVGASSAPQRGYSFEDRVGDLRAVLDHLDLPPTCVMAFSAGVPVALGYALARPGDVNALILLDYPAVSRQLTGEWAEQVRPFAAERDVPEHVVESMVRESATVELWEDLSTIDCPVLLIVGGQSPLMKEEDLSRYRQALPQVQVELFEDSGHEVYKPDYERFMRTIERFLLGVD